MQDTTRRNINDLLNVIDSVSSAWEKLNEDHGNWDLRLALSGAIGDLRGQTTVVRISMKHDPELKETAHV